MNSISKKNIFYLLSGSFVGTGIYTYLNKLYAHKFNNNLDEKVVLKVYSNICKKLLEKYEEINSQFDIINRLNIIGTEIYDSICESLELNKQIYIICFTNEVLKEYGVEIDKYTSYLENFNHIDIFNARYNEYKPKFLIKPDNDVVLRAAKFYSSLLIIETHSIKTEDILYSKYKLSYDQMMYFIISNNLIDDIQNYFNLFKIKYI